MARSASERVSRDIMISFATIKLLNQLKQYTVQVCCFGNLTQVSARVLLFRLHPRAYSGLGLVGRWIRNIALGYAVPEAEGFTWGLQNAAVSSGLCTPSG